MAPKTPKLEPQDTFEVALNGEDEQDFNALVLSWADVVWPIECNDVPGIAFEGTRMRSYDGAFDIAGAREGKERIALVLYYRFADVRFGLYELALRLPKGKGTPQYTPVIADLLYRRAGVFIGNQQIDERRPTPSSAPWVPPSMGTLRYSELDGRRLPDAPTPDGLPR